MTSGRIPHLAGTAVRPASPLERPETAMTVSLHCDVTLGVEVCGSFAGALEDAEVLVAPVAGATTPEVDVDAATAASALSVTGIDAARCAAVTEGPRRGSLKDCA
jgi:hypothetical protein